MFGVDAGGNEVVINTSLTSLGQVLDILDHLRVALSLSLTFVEAALTGALRRPRFQYPLL